MREEIRRARDARGFILGMAREMYPSMVKAYKTAQVKMRRQLGLPERKSDFTPEQREMWNAYLLKSRNELNESLVERYEKDSNKNEQLATKVELKLARDAMRSEKRKALQERRRAVKEKYGFTLGKKPTTPEEIEGRKRYDRDQDAAMRERKREEIRIYNREYRRKQRAAALERAQEKWSSAQWAVYQKKLADKECPKGSPQWLVREVVRYLASVQQISEEMVTERLIELGGMDFLIKGAESMGQQRCSAKSIVIAAVRALALFLDPENTVMFATAAEERDER